MKLKINISGIMRPSGIALFAVILSFCAWLFPDFGTLRKGFTTPDHPDLLSSFILFSWYLLIFTSLILGQKLGVSFSAQRCTTTNIPPLDSLAIYWIFTILGAIGTTATLFRIFQTLPLLEAVIYIYMGQGNRLKNTLYGDYSAGILSLRYLVLYSASLAIYRIVRLRRLSLLNIANIALLAVTALISSRLILIATILISIFLLTFGKRTVRISLVRLGTFAGILFIILSLLNSSRNSNFYEARNLSFAEAGASEIITYLGAPFHVSIAAARRTDEIVAERPEFYRELIDVEEGLTTNSAFVQLHEQMGYACWFYISAICCLMGFMFSWLISFGRTSCLLPCGAILYASAELWRLDLFQQGIFIVWFVLGITIPVAFLLFGKHHLHEGSRSPRKSRSATGYALGNIELRKTEL
jgi:hypothetical protein